MATASTVKDQYHHVIPRFILRRFQVEIPNEAPVSSLSKRKKKQPPPEYIYFYNIKTGEVELRAIATVYGTKNLYKDARNPNNVMELEEKLSILESKAGQVISDIHKSIGVAPTVSLRRKEVEDLRRFLFIMHYRREALSHSYFQEDHPENIPTRAWLKSYKERYSLKSAVDVWLHVLRYYLDEPHEQIVADYSKIVRKYGPQGLQNMTRHIDPSVKFEAMAYGVQAGSFYMSIWEASDEEEFLLGHNGFGLWEGLHIGSPCVHRIFVTSPRIAIILRSRFVALTGENLCRSDLLNIPASPADVQYSSNRDTLARTINNDVEKLIKYKQSSEAKHDIFRFTKTKLSVAQTNALNAVILRNVKADGSLTFLSPLPTLRTLRDFNNATDPENYLTKRFFDRLTEPLTYPALLPTTPTKLGPPSTARNVSYTIPLKGPAAQRSQPSARPFSETVPSEYTNPLRDRLRDLIYAELAGVPQYSSRYGSAYAIQTLCRHDEMPDSIFVAEQGLLTSEAYHRFTSLLLPPPDGFQSHPENHLIRNMPEHDSAFFFEYFLTLFETLGLNLKERDDWLTILIHQVAVVGFVEHIAQTRHDVLDQYTDVTGVQLLR